MLIKAIGAGEDCWNCVVTELSPSTGSKTTENHLGLKISMSFLNSTGPSYLLAWLLLFYFR